MQNLFHLYIMHIIHDTSFRSGEIFLLSKFFNYVMKEKFLCKLSFTWEHSKARQANITHLWVEIVFH